MHSRHASSALEQQRGPIWQRCWRLKCLWSGSMWPRRRKHSCDMAPRGVCIACELDDDTHRHRWSRSSTLCPGRKSCSWADAACNLWRTTLMRTSRASVRYRLRAAHAAACGDRGLRARHQGDTMGQQDDTPWEKSIGQQENRSWEEYGYRDTTV